MVAGNHQVLAEVAAELEAYRRGSPGVIVDYGALPGGGWILCGGREDESCWNAAYVRTNRAVLPLAVGSYDQVRQKLGGILGERIAVWDPERFPPPTVRVDGVAYHFTAARGRRLIGVVECKRGAVVLAAVDGGIAVIDFAGRRRFIRHAGHPLSLREIDIDKLRRLDRPGHDAEPVTPRRLSRSIRAEHHRIVHGTLVDVGDGPSISEVIRVYFKELAQRALALAPLAGKELKGQTRVEYVAEYIGKAAALGLGNLVGRISKLHATIKEHFPEFDISLALFADALTLLEAVGSSVIPLRRPHQRMRRLNLEGLSNPHSRAHRRLCRETRSRHPPGATTQHAGDAAAAGRSATTAQEKSATTPSPGHSDPPGPSTAATPAQAASAAEVAAIFRSAAAMYNAAAIQTTPTTIPASAGSEQGEMSHADPRPAPPPEQGGAPLVESSRASTQAGADVVAAEAEGPDRPGPPATGEAQLIDAINIVSELGPAAGQALLFSIHMGRSWIDDASDPTRDFGAADPHVRPDADQEGEGIRPAEEAVPTRSAARRRRRLHLSPDHFFELPIVASATTRSMRLEPTLDGEGRTHDQVLGRTRPVGDGPGILGPRGPPTR